MLRRFALMLVMFSGLLSLILPAPTTAKADDAPYIYYYSSRINAFIIERADGTDTHILGRGLMPPPDGDYAHVQGPGWSPSGKWFAWTIAYDKNGYVQGSRAYALKADGSRRIEQLDNLINAQMAWAPDQDLLFVATEYSNEADPTNSRAGWYSHHDFYLFDLEANVTLIEDREVRFIKPGMTLGRGSSPHFPIITWTNDGHIIVKYDALPLDNNPDTDTVLYKIFDSRTSVAARIQTDTEDFTITPGDPSPKGELLKIQGNAVILENILTGTTRSVGQIPSSEKIASIYWPPNVRYALVEADNLYLINLDKASLSLLTARPNQTEKHAIVENGFHFPVWSPNGRHALLLIDNKLYHLNAESAVLEELPIALNDDCLCIMQAAWVAAGTLLIDEPHFATNSGYWYQADFDAGTYQIFPVTPEQARNIPSLNDDRRYAAYIRDGIFVYDTQTKIENVFRPPPESFSAMPDGRAFWDQSGKWLLTFRNGFVAGGGTPCCYHISVIRIDGAFQRDLTQVNSFFLPTLGVNADWLPLRVKLSDLPPVETKSPVPIPQKVLSGREWSDYLDWSPDSKQLLSVSYDQHRLWDIQTNQSLFVKLPGYTLDYIWVKTAGGTYSLNITPRKSQEYDDENPAVISPDGRMAAVPWNGNFAIRDTQTGEWRFNIPDSPISTRINLTFSPNGQLIAVYNYHYPTTLWDTRTGRLLATLPDSSFDIAFSPDGEWLATTRSWDILLWNVRDLTGQ